MRKDELILIGGGGHCRACIDVIETEGRYKISGIIDVEQRLRQKVLGYEIIAIDNDISKLADKYRNFLITIGIGKDSSKRIEKFESVKRLGVEFPLILSPSAFISRSTLIGDGTIVMHNAVVNSNASVGKNCIVNTMAIIEHDTRVGDHCHISTGSVVNGYCQVGDRVFIGSNSVIIDYLKICDDVIVGAGAVVTKSISEKGVYIGNPARKVDESKKI